MLRDYTVLPVTAAAGLIAGAGATTFLAAALSAAGAFWLSKHRQGSELCFATLDPCNPDENVILDALRRALDRAGQTGKPVRLRLAAWPSGTRSPVLFSLSREGDVQIKAPSGTVSLQRPGVWLPDHPLPLPLTRDRSLTLVFEPCGPSRIRVSLPSAAACQTRHWLLLSLLAATACTLDAGWLLAATLGVAFQSYLLEKQDDRAPKNTDVHGR